MGFFQKIKSGLKKTRDSITDQLEQLSKNFSKIDEDFLEELEEILIMSDVGVTTAEMICKEVRKKAKQEKAYTLEEINDLVQSVMAENLTEEAELTLEGELNIFLIIGVNGVGKTTSIGKLANYYQNQGKKVMLVAGDTFRAAAVEQLSVWAERCKIDIIKSQQGSDPASVIYDGIASAKAKKADILLIDTAGRLHNKKNLMEELSKINRIIEREGEGILLETLLVLDGTTGQNGISQARQFCEVTKITGLILTKLDGTAKGGIVIGIKNELNIPVRFIGLGEKVDDLEPFQAKEYVKALFSKSKEGEEDE